MTRLDDMMRIEGPSRMRGRRGRVDRRRDGFTLVELLTVMAIISILIAILLPSLSGARNQGRITKCRANVRELASATLRYMSQESDRFPTVTDCNDSDCVFWNGHQYFGWNGKTLNGHGNMWVRNINKELGLELQEPAAGNAGLAECPSDAGAPGQSGSPEKLFLALGTSYAMNPILCQGNVSDWKYREKDISVSQVIQPSQKVLVADHIAFGLTYNGFWTAIRPGWHDTFRPAAVVGFIDGHADYVKGRGSLKEWQWYGEASGAGFVQDLTTKVNWNIFQEAQ